MSLPYPSIRKSIQLYSAIASMAVKSRLAYDLWVWSDFLSTLGVMLIYVYFWRALYSHTAILGGLDYQQTISYILLARILAPLVETRVIFGFGFLIREGGVALELTRPLDFQFRYLIETLAEMVTFLIQRLPVFLIAWLFLGLSLPSDPLLWLGFFISLFLGQMILFFFDFAFACIAFYTTETWGLSVLRVSFGSFFSGALVPLALMPAWLQQAADAMPFAQGIAVPISFLSGLTSSHALISTWLLQLGWLLGLFILSRIIFGIAVRKITVQGG